MKIIRNSIEKSTHSIANRSEKNGFELVLCVEFHTTFRTPDEIYSIERLKLTQVHYCDLVEWNAANGSDFRVVQTLDLNVCIYMYSNAIENIHSC